MVRIEVKNDKRVGTTDKELLRVTAGAMDESFDEIMTVHDEVEKWVLSKPGGQLFQDEVCREIHSCCEYAIVEKDNIKPYIMSLLDMRADEMADDLVKAIERSELAKVKRSIVFEIKIPPELAGTRILGSYLLGTKKRDDGDFEMVFVGYREKSTLVKTYRWLEANHDVHKVRTWLKGKLVLQIQRQMGTALTFYNGQ